MRIYIAGPYSRGDVAQNVRRAVDAADRLRNMGHTPFVPHLSHFWHMAHYRTEEDWYAWGLEWLRQCEAVLRLPGESKGGDAEVLEARRLGMEVYHSLNDVPAAIP